MPYISLSSWEKVWEELNIEVVVRSGGSGVSGVCLVREGVYGERWSLAWG